MTTRTKRLLPTGLLLVALTLGVYARVGGFAFVNFDDPDYVTQNPQVPRGLTARGFVWALTAEQAGNWHPLTWLSHMADVSLFGLRPGPHHLMSVFLHAVAAGILFLLLTWMTGSAGSSAFVAAVFALHPLHVESVAWISERKDVLSALLLVLTLAAWLFFLWRPAATSYLGALLLFVLALMAKPMVVTLPCILLLLDWWPLGRLGNPAGRIDPGRVAAACLEKLPFFLLAGLASAITYHAQSQGRLVKTVGEFPLVNRLTNAMTGYVWYLVKAVVPQGLSVIYFHSPAVQPGKVAVATLLLVGLSMLAVREARRRPWFLIGWLWYLGMLVPVIGFVQVGLQSTADRYAYLPLVGLSLALAWGAAEWARGRPAGRRIVLVASGLAVAAMMTLTFVQLGYWRNSVTLFTRAVEIDPGNAIAWTKLGVGRLQERRYDEAERAFRKSVAVNSGYVEGWYNLGILLVSRRKSEEAVVVWRRLQSLDAATAEALGRFIAFAGGNPPGP